MLWSWYSLFISSARKIYFLHLLLNTGGGGVWERSCCSCQTTLLIFSWHSTQENSSPLSVKQQHQLTSEAWKMFSARFFRNVTTGCHKPARWYEWLIWGAFLYTNGTSGNQKAQQNGIKCNILECKVSWLLSREICGAGLPALLTYFPAVCSGWVFNCQGHFTVLYFVQGLDGHKGSVQQWQGVQHGEVQPSGLMQWCNAA